MIFNARLDNKKKLKDPFKAMLVIVTFISEIFSSYKAESIGI